jgi:hypothetical protein
LLDGGQGAEEGEGDAEADEDEHPGEDGAVVVFAGFVFAGEGPDEDHDPADDGNGGDEHHEHPGPDGDVVAVASLFHFSVVMAGLREIFNGNHD